MVATGMIIEAQYVVQAECSRSGHEVLYSGERLSDRAPINVRTVGPGASKAVRQQFSEIAGILSRVDNENCLSTLATGQQMDGTLYLVTLAHEAGSLEGLVGEGMPGRELAEIGVQLFDGLAHLHGQGVALGFLAPSGITLGSLRAQPRVQIVDYSAARLESAPRQPSIEGPKEWQAPEVRAGQPPSFAADVYSAGLVLSALASSNLTEALASLLESLVAKDPARRPSAAEAFARFAAFIDASPLSFDVSWLPPADSRQLSSGVFGLAESPAADLRATHVSVATVGVSDSSGAAEPVVFVAAPKSRAIGIGLAVAGLLAAGVVAFVVTASPSATTETGVADDGASAVAAGPLGVAANGEPAAQPVAEIDEVPLEGNPIVWLSQVNRQDLGATLPFRDRHRLLKELASREGVYAKVNHRWNALLDLWQAGDSERPCATFAAALATVDEPPATDAERDLLARVVVPVPAAGSRAGVGEDDSCAGLAEAFAELTEAGAEPEPVSTRKRSRSPKAAPRPTAEPLPRKSPPPSKADTKKPAHKEPAGTVATKLDDDLRGI